MNTCANCKYAYKREYYNLNSQDNSLNWECRCEPPKIVELDKYGKLVCCFPLISSYYFACRYFEGK